MSRPVKLKVISERNERKRGERKQKDKKKQEKSI